jgi:hypothetical protein
MMWHTIAATLGLVVGAAAGVVLASAIAPNGTTPKTVQTRIVHCTDGERNWISFASDGCGSAGHEE